MAQAKAGAGKAGAAAKAAKPAARPRNAAATRAAILASARRAFAARGYDGAGVREIAAGAGVTAMLVNRYFGSKEKLFAAVAADTMTGPSVLSEAFLTAEPGAAIAARLVALTARGGSVLDGFQIMLRSAASERAAGIGRTEIEKHHLRLVREALRGPHAAERAALLLSAIAGFQAMRQMIGLTPLAKGDARVLSRLLGRMLDAAIAPGA